MGRWAHATERPVVAVAAVVEAAAAPDAVAAGEPLLVGEQLEARPGESV